MGGTAQDLTLDEVIRVEGVNDLVKAFMLADRGLGGEVRSALKDAGEIVRVDAEHRALAEITHITQPWARMRLGITGSNIVYIVPKNRSTRLRTKRRPNFGRLLLRRAMEPSLRANRLTVEARVVEALENLNQNAGLIKGLRSLA